jgi:hypothetical protein
MPDAMRSSRAPLNLEKLFAMNAIRTHFSGETTTLAAAASLSARPSRTRHAKIAGLAAFAALAMALNVPNAAMAAPFGDGNFETPGHPGFQTIAPSGTIGPWKVTSGTVDYGTAPAQTPCDGGAGNCVDLNGTGPGAISQTFTTCTPTYLVSFRMSRHHMLATQTATVVAHAGSGTWTFTNGPSNGPPGTWTSETFSFPSTGPLTTIGFSSTTHDDPVGAGPEIDNVVVRASCT